MVIVKYIIYVIVYLINMVILIMRTVAVLHRVCRLLNSVRDSHKTWQGCSSGWPSPCWNSLSDFWGGLYGNLWNAISRTKQENRKKFYKTCFLQVASRGGTSSGRDSLHGIGCMLWTELLYPSESDVRRRPDGVRKAGRHRWRYRTISDDFGRNRPICQKKLILWLWRQNSAWARTPSSPDDVFRL